MDLEYLQGMIYELIVFITNCYVFTTKCSMRLIMLVRITKIKSGCLKIVTFSKYITNSETASRFIDTKYMLVEYFTFFKNLFCGSRHCLLVVMIMNRY